MQDFNTFALSVWQCLVACHNCSMLLFADSPSQAIKHPCVSTGLESVSVPPFQ
jgi:hypothetical protein